MLMTAKVVRWDFMNHRISTRLSCLVFPALSPPSLPGAILLSQSLDYETCRDYFLTVEARDGGTPPLSAITTVNVNVTDVNDNAPVFGCQLYAAVVSEGAATGSSVIQVCLHLTWACFCFSPNQNAGFHCAHQHFQSFD